MWALVKCARGRGLRHMKLWQHWSFKNRVTLFTCVVFLASMWSLSWLAARWLRDDLQQVLSQQQLSTVKVVAAQLDLQHTSDVQVLTVVVADAAAALRKGPAATHAYLAQRGAWLTHAFAQGVLVYGADGTALAGWPRSAEQLGMNDLNSTAVAAALKDGKTTWRDVQPGPRRPAPWFSVTTPIRDAQGRVVGALWGMSEVGASTASNGVIRSLRGSSGQYGVMATQQRVRVMATDPAGVMEKLPLRGVNPAIDRLWDGTEDTAVVVNPQGQEGIMSVARVGTSGWRVVAWLPTAQAFEPVVAMQRSLNLITLGLSLLAGLAMWWMLRRQLAPVQQAVQTLSKSAHSGEVPKQMAVARHDEFGALVQGINGLLSQWEQREAALSESTQQYGALVADLQVGMVIHSPQGEVRMCNQLASTLLGADHVQMPGNTLVDPLSDVVREDGSPLTAQDDPVAQVLVKQQGAEVMVIGVRRPGMRQRMWLHVTAKPQFHADGSLRQVVTTVSDVTNRTYSDLNESHRGQVLEKIASGSPLNDILTSLVEGVERLRPGIRCTIMLLSADGRHFDGGVAPSMPEFFNAAVYCMEIGEGVGSCGTACATGERVIVEDVNTHPYWAPFTDIAQRAHIGSCWSQPIFASDGQVLGTFAMYDQRTQAPQAPDIALIQQSARLASIAIEKSIAAQRLRDSEARFRSMMEDIEGVAAQGYGPDGTVTFWNKASESLYGYTAQEAMGRNLMDLIVPTELQETVRQAIVHMFCTGQVIPSGELLLVAKDGSRVPVFSSHALVKPTAGPPELFCLDIDLTERKRMEDQIRQFAFFDVLTHLPNRRLLDDRLALAMASSARTGRFGALVYLDLDNFKPLNDRHGHDVGDLLLVEVAQRLKNGVRETDSVARVGGDEFVVLLAELSEDRTASEQQVRVVVEKIRGALAQTYVLQVLRSGQPEAQVKHHCSASLGVALFVDHTCTAVELLKQADAAMYQAKEAGRNRVQFSDGLDNGSEPMARV